MIDDSDVILPLGALRGMRVGVSVSESSDLSKLGLLERHFRLALGEIARSVLLLGGGLVYGGHLEAEGYTAFLAFELKRYGRRDRPLTLVVPWTEHRHLLRGALEKWEKDLGLYGTLILLDREGVPIVERAEAADLRPVTADLVERSLTGLRHFMTGITDCRVLIGGRRMGFSGRFPGVLEEALVSIENQIPVFLAGGFGGVVLDAIRVLRPEDAAWAQFDSIEPNDPRVDEGLRALASLNTRLKQIQSNGLSPEENRRLAATHRPSDIASLVSLGLGRIAQARQST